MEGDKLLDGNAWQASSHKGLRVPPKQPQITKLEPIATVGIVLHLADVQGDATLTIEPKDANLAKATVPLKDVLAGKSQSLWNGGAVVRLISTATLINDARTEDDFPAAAYGPDGTLWVAYTSYTVRDDTRRIEQKQFQKQPDSFKELYTPEFGDQVWLKSYRGGKWSEPIAVTGPKESIIRCAVAVEENGTVQVIYSAMRDQRHSIFARNVTKGQLGKEVALASDGASNLSPVACTTQKGMVVVGYQHWDAAKGPSIRGVGLSGTTTFPATFSPDGQGGVWQVSLAPDADNGVAALFDSYANGDYDIRSVYTKGGSTAGQTLVSSAKFEARPSAAYDPQGRLWIAYEEAPRAGARTTARSTTRTAIRFTTSVRSRSSAVPPTESSIDPPRNCRPATSRRP